MSSTSWVCAQVRSKAERLVRDLGGNREIAVVIKNAELDFWYLSLFGDLVWEVWKPTSGFLSLLHSLSGWGLETEKDRNGAFQTSGVSWRPQLNTKEVH